MGQEALLMALGLQVYQKRKRVPRDLDWGFERREKGRCDAVE
jgi:hypothetical protein